MFKEKGYDEFLAEKIREGLSDSEAGRVYSLEQANAEWQTVIEEIAEELKEFERTVAYA